MAPNVYDSIIDNNPSYHTNLSLSISVKMLLIIDINVSFTRLKPLLEECLISYDVSFEYNK